MFNRFSENWPLLLLLAQNKRLSSTFMQIMCIIKFWPGRGEMQRWNAKVFVWRDRIIFAIIAFKQLFSFTILIRIFKFPRIVIMICCKISVGRLGGWLDTWIAVRKCRGDNYSLAALYSNTHQVVNTKRNKYFPSPDLIRTPLFWPFDAAFPARFITAGRLAGFAANLGFYWSFWERQCWQAINVVNIDFHQKHLANWQVFLPIMIFKHSPKAFSPWLAFSAVGCQGL